MGILIAAILFGLGFTLLSLQNTAVVTLHAGGYMFFVPVFLLVLGSLLVGLFIAWFLSAIGWISSAFTMHAKDTQIRRTEGEVNSLQKRIHELEIENSRLRGENHIMENPPVAEPSARRSFFDRFRRPATA